MNLLELMLKEEVIFPVYAQYAVQDYTGRIKFSDKKPVYNQERFSWDGCWCIHYIDGQKGWKTGAMILLRDINMHHLADQWRLMKKSLCN